MHQPNAVTTVIIERETLFREGLVALLESSVYRIEKALPALDEELTEFSPLQPDLFIVGGTHEAIVDVVRRLRLMHPSAQVVALLGEFDFIVTMALIRVGAHGVILKSINRECMLHSLDVIMHDEVVLPAAFRRELTLQADPSGGQSVENKLNRPALSPEHSLRRNVKCGPLSARETLVLYELLKGETNKLIARRLEISEATVKTHVKTIFRKIGVRNRTQAALWAGTNIPSLMENLSEGGEDCEMTGIGTASVMIMAGATPA